MSQISIIVPIYNVEKYLNRCVDSVLNQTFTDFDLILINDGSPDNSKKICDDYAEKDSRIHVIHKENGGLSDARNAGIDWAFDHSDSEWLTFIDSDDWIHPRYLEALYDAVRNTGLSISSCGFGITESDDPSVDEAALQPVIRNTFDYFREQYVNAIVAWGKLYRKEDFKTVRYPKGKVHEDEFTTYKILFKYREIALIDQPLYAYFQNTAGITKSGWNPKRLVKIEALEERLEFIKKNKLDPFYDFTVGCLLGNIIEHYLAITQAEDPEHKKHLPFVRAHLRKVLRIAKQKKLFTIAQYEKLYEYAYPSEMWIYRDLREREKDDQA